MDLSIVIPRVNEAENIEATHSRVKETLPSFNGISEVIADNDGSLNKTAEVLSRLAEWNGKLKIVSYPKNFAVGWCLG